MGLPNEWSLYAFIAAMALLPVTFLLPVVAKMLSKISFLSRIRVRDKLQRESGVKRSPIRLSLYHRCLSVLLAYIMLLTPVGLQSIAQASILYTGLDTRHWTEGNRTIQYAYDANGSLTSKITSVTLPQEELERIIYEYNLQNRLAKVSVSTDGGQTWDSITEYKYDPDGNRVEKIVDGTSTKYLIDSQNLTGYSQVFIETTGANKTAYIIGDDILAQATGTGQTDIQYLLYDGHGSTRQLADSTGNLISNESYSYDAYGILLGGERATQTSLLYTGEQYDTSAEMYYLRARYYDPLNGRFNQTDPFAGSPQDPQSLHKYLYAHGNPVNGIDPSGELLVGIIVTIGIVASLIAILLNVYRAIRGWGSTKCGVCGPDVTEPLSRFKSQVTRDFNKLTLWQQTVKCATMWGLDNWDIDGLHSSFGIYNGCSTGSCRDTVAVHGQCYSRHAVNYYLWGVMNSLCSLLPGRSTDFGLQWTLFSGDALCKREWARAGLRGDITGVSCPQYATCEATCWKKIEGNLMYRWGYRRFHPYPGYGDELW